MPMTVLNQTCSRDLLNNCSLCTMAPEGTGPRYRPLTYRLGLLLLRCRGLGIQNQVLEMQSCGGSRHDGSNFDDDEKMKRSIHVLVAGQGCVLRGAVRPASEGGGFCVVRDDADRRPAALRRWVDFWPSRAASEKHWLEPLPADDSAIHRESS